MTSQKLLSNFLRKKIVIVSHIDGETNFKMNFYINFKFSVSFMRLFVVNFSNIVSEPSHLCLNALFWSLTSKFSLLHTGYPLDF